MLDIAMRTLIERPLTAMARQLARAGIGADGVTVAGLLLGLAGAACIVPGLDGPALVLMAANRLADGLDGALARLKGPTDRGGYLDIVLDFMFYGAVPLAFVLRDPPANAVAGAILLFAFYVNGASFLAFAALAAKRRIETSRHGRKAIHYSAGLIEGTETIMFFAAMIWLPGHFREISLCFAGLTLVTACGRIRLAMATFDGQAPRDVGVR